MQNNDKVKFCHLHCHSDYSLYDGFQKVDSMAKKASELNMESIALTDHGKVAGLCKFYKACKTHGVKPILGIEAYVVNDLGNKKAKRYHQTILAKNKEGYENLLKLSTLSHDNRVIFFNNEFPCIDFNMMKEYSNGLIVLSGCISSEFSNLIVEKNSPEEALDLAKKYKDVWGDDYYIEVMYTKHAPQRVQIKHGIDIAKKLGIKVVSTNDCLNSDSIIYTENGAKLIKDIRVGDKVLTHKGRYRKVEVVEEKYTDKNKLKISLKNGNQYNSPNRLIVTEDHKFYAFSKKENKNIWIKAKELDENEHYLYLPKENQKSNTPLDALDIAEDHKTESIIIKNDVDWMYVFGLFCGDGCATQTSNLFDICVNPENIHAQKLLEYKFKEFGSWDKGWKNFRGKFYRYRMTNRYFSRFFKKYFYNKNREKVIPEFVFSTSIEMQSAFVCGMLDADGHISRNKDKVSFHNTSLNLVDGFRRLMAFGGVHELIQIAKGNVDKFRFRWKSKEKPQYTWSCNKENMCLLRSFLSMYKKYDFEISEKCKKNFFRIIKDDCILVKFKKESYSDNESVWDLQVEEDSSFCTSFGVVHNCHYTNKKDAEFQKAKIAISRNGPVFSEGEDVSEYYIKSYDEMAEVFNGHMIEYLHNTMEISEKCNVTIEKSAELPHFKIPQDDEDFNKYKKRLVMRNDEEAYLFYQAEKGLREKGLWDCKETDQDGRNYKDRLFYELEIIRWTGFTRYFLIVWEYCNFARSIDILIGKGRGSGAGSLVLYCLGVTSVDAVKRHLSFDRFLFAKANYKAKIDNFFDLEEKEKNVPDEACSLC